MKYTFHSFYKGKKIEISGEELTIYAAQKQAAKQFKAKKSYEVDIYLVGKDNKNIIHTPVD